MDKIRERLPVGTLVAWKAGETELIGVVSRHGRFGGWLFVEVAVTDGRRIRVHRSMLRVVKPPENKNIP